MKVLVLPRDPNPYQGDLYREMRGVDVRYAEGPTPSQTLNLLLLPAVLAWHRAAGARVLHVHWVHPFQPGWARFALARAVLQWWFGVVLAGATALGYRIVWTAHNVVPHEPVFRDDVAARRTLVRHCDAVVAHADATAGVVRGWGATRVAVIPQGVRGPVGDTHPPTRAEARRALGLDPDRTVVVSFGNVLPYKGIDVLLDAAACLDDDLPLDVVVVGRCRDDRLRRDLEARAARAGARVCTCFAFVPDDELAALVAAADFAAFPFRRVTNSSSVATALGAGLPVLVPDLPELAELPAGAVVRHEPGVDGLAGALTRAARTDAATRARLRSEAGRHAATHTWSTAATRTRALYAEVLAG